METKKHLFGTTEKSDFILNMTQEGTRKLMGMFCIISMWLLAICALPYYLTKNAVREVEDAAGFTVTHYYTENTVVIMATALVIVGFLCMLMFLIARMKNEATLKNKKGLITLAVVAVLGFVAMITSDYKMTAFFGHSYRNDGYLQFLACCGFIFMGLIVTGDDWRRRFCDNLVAIGAFEAVIGILQCIFPGIPNFFSELFKGFPSGLADELINDQGYVVTEQPCATGLMCSPMALAAVLTILFAFAAAGFMYAKGGKRKLLYLIACALMAVASGLTHMIPGLVGIPCVLGVLLAIEIIRLVRKNVLWNQKALDNALTCCVITIAVTAAAFLGLKFGGQLKQYDEDIIFTETFTRLSTSYHSRSDTSVDIYEDYRHIGTVALRYELDQGMYFGVGQDNLDCFYGAIQGFRTDRLYNDYLDIILQRGIVTFVFYCVFLVYALICGLRATVAFYKKQQPFYGAAALAGFIAYLAVMFWNTGSCTSTYFMYLCVGMMVMYGSKKALSPKEKKQEAREKAAKGRSKE